MARGREAKPPTQNGSSKLFDWFKNPFNSEPPKTNESQGLITPGNIDLSKRKVVENADGSFSTVKSASFEFDGKHVLLPTLDPDGKHMTDDQAVERYRKTGEHLGIYNSEAAATAAAKKISKGQEALDPKKGARAVPQSSPVPKQSTQEMRSAIADLEKAVKTMPGVEPIIVGPPKPGETPAQYLKRWNEAHAK